jgi:hypothetical protein
MPFRTHLAAGYKDSLWKDSASCSFTETVNHQCSWIQEAVQNLQSTFRFYWPHLLGLVFRWISQHMFADLCRREMNSSLDACHIQYHVHVTAMYAKENTALTNRDIIQTNMNNEFIRMLIIRSTKFAPRCYLCRFLVQSGPPWLIL